jgi:hypothetical protein
MENAPNIDDYTPSLPCAQKFRVIRQVRTTPLSAPDAGFYAETFLEEDGWTVSHYGETREKAEANLRHWIMSGEWDRHKNR